jgi:hypothetical protein
LDLGSSLILMGVAEVMRKVAISHQLGGWEGGAPVSWYRHLPYGGVSVYLLELPVRNTCRTYLFVSSQRFVRSKSIFLENLCKAQRVSLFSVWGAAPTDSFVRRLLLYTVHRNWWFQNIILSYCTGPKLRLLLLKICVAIVVVPVGLPVDIYAGA